MAWIVIISRNMSTRYFDAPIPSNAQSWRNVSVPMATRFPQQQILQWIAISQGTRVPNMKFISLQTAKLSRYVSVAMVTGFPWEQVKVWVAVASRDLCTKCEDHLPSNSKDISICLCCHGNKVSIATNHMMDCCCLKGSLYQIWSSFTFEQQRYKHMPLLPW